MFVESDYCWFAGITGLRSVYVFCVNTRFVVSVFWGCLAKCDGACILMMEIFSD